MKTGQSTAPKFSTIAIRAFRWLAGALALALAVHPDRAYTQNPSTLKEALVSYSWTVHRDTHECNYRFLPDGTALPDAENWGRWMWVATGPRTFTLWGADGTPAGLGGKKDEPRTCTFDETFSNFRGEWAKVRGGGNHFVSGTRQGANAAPAPAPDPVPNGPAGGNLAKSMIEACSKLEPQAVALATMPLDRTAPESVQEMLTEIMETLKDEVQKSPQASPATYALALRIFGMCSAVLNERDATAKRAATATSGKPHLMGEWSNAWATKAEGYRKTFTMLYSQFRDAARNSPPPKIAVTGGGVGFVDFPPVPAPDATPQSATPAAAPEVDRLSAGKKGQGGLNGGAYDHHYIWTPRPLPLNIYR